MVFRSFTTVLQSFGQKNATYSSSNVQKSELFWKFTLLVPLYTQTFLMRPDENLSISQKADMKKNIHTFWFMIILSTYLKEWIVLKIHHARSFIHPDVPDAPKKLTPSEVTRSAVTLTWEPPESDGGSVITGYIVERKSPTTSRWVRVNKSPVRDTTYTVPDVSEGQEYEFRVLAENAAGISKPSQPTGTIKAVDPYSQLLFYVKHWISESQNLRNL